MKPKILVITSTVRKERLGPKVAEWYMNEASKVAPQADFELLDIAQLDLPLFNEPIDPLTAEGSGKLTGQQKELAQPITSADGYVILTSEYNHTTPGPLKNFLDYLPPGAWAHKAAAFVGYGASAGGFWAVSHLMHVMTYLKVMSIMDTVNIYAVWDAFDEQGKPKPGYIRGDMGTQLKELLWWAGTLKNGRKS